MLSLRAGIDSLDIFLDAVIEQYFKDIRLYKFGLFYLFDMLNSFRINDTMSCYL